MSRTAHHISPGRGRVLLSGPGWRKRAIITHFDLRYTFAAPRRGDRIRPVRIVRRLRVTFWPRQGWHDESVRAIAAFDERKARQHARNQLEHIRRVVNTAADASAAWDCEVHPVRHRHNAIWQAW